MHLSISNSRITGHWWQTLIQAALIAIVVIGFFEYYLAFKGYKAWSSDSAALWSAKRTRVNWSNNPIVLVGASRIQLDIDVKELERLTNRPVYQLAVDGADARPVLEDLSSDVGFRGTVIAAIQDHSLAKPYNEHDKPSDWIEYYNQNFSGRISPTIEATLIAWFQIISPFHSIEMSMSELATRLLKGKSTNIFLKTSANRDRYADYSKVKQPQYYVTRVIKHFGYEPELPSQLTVDSFSKHMRKIINGLPVSSTKHLNENVTLLNRYARKIEERGGQVIYVRMPTDKLIYAIDQARTPRNIFWDELAYSGVETIHFEDIPGISKMNLPDGSHLDQSQKKPFTRLLFNRLNSIMES